MLTRQTDEQIVRRVLEGDRAAFRILVDRYSGVVHGVAYAHLGNRAEAEEVGQDTFLRAFESLDRLRNFSHIGGWLVAVARHRSRDILRKRRREQDAQDALAGEVVPVTPRPDREEFRRLVWDHLQRMADDDREILVLRYFLGMKRRMIAAQLGITPAAAAKRLQRARESLGRSLVDALGPELELREKPEPQAERIMGFVLVADAPWQAAAPVAAGATVAASAGGLSLLVKAVGSVAALALVAMIGWGLWTRLPEFGETPPDGATPGAASDAPAEDSVGVSRETALAPEPSLDPGIRALLETPIGTVRGLVADERGRPIPGAVVTLDRRPFDPERADPLGPLELTTETDNEGRFAFSDVGIVTWSADAWRLYRYRLYVKQPGRYAYAAFVWDPLAPEQYAELVLRPAGVLEGVVAGFDGRPIPFAKVTPRWEPWPEIEPADMPDLTPVYADARGRFRLDSLWPEAYTLDVTGAGHLPETTTLLRTDRTNLRISLRKGGQARGRVVDASGEPLAGLPVVAAGYGATPTVRGVTREDGTFTLDGLVGSYALLPADRLHVLASPVAVRLERTDKQTDLELAAVEGAAVEGRVVDPASGVGMARVRVRALPEYPMPLSDELYTFTDSDGAYRISGLRPGPYTVSADVPGEDVPPQDVSLEPGQTLDGVDFNVERPFTLAGRVLDAQGTPVNGAWVALLDGPADYREGMLTQDDGRFEFRRSKADSDAYLAVIHPSGVSELAGPQAFGKDDATAVELVLQPPCFIEGTVVDASGAPVSRGRVVAQPRRASSRLLPHPASLAGTPVTAGLVGETALSPAGRFRLGPLAPGAYSVVVNLPDAPAEAAHPTANVDLEPGDARDRAAPGGGRRAPGRTRGNGDSGRQAAGRPMRLSRTAGGKRSRGLVR
jgi:RNA polymerase sigma-70 factor (ECF subfamily)